MPDSDKRPRIEVCFSPYLYPLHKDDHDIIVVIDVLRATSAICAAIDYGVKKIIPVSSIEEAREYQSMGYIVAAERKGEIVSGFDLGNSPYGFMNDKLIDKTVVMTTTNGTRAINMASHAETVVIGSLLNVDAIIDWLLPQEKNILCLCSGWQNKFNLEDTICAGAISEGLIASGNYQSIEDSSIASKYIFRSAKENYIGYLKSSSHRRRLKKLNLNEDIKYCLTPNQTDVIPILKNGEIVKLEREVPLKS